MASSERVLTGRRVRAVDAWPGSAGWGSTVTIDGTAALVTPDASPAVDLAALEAAQAVQLQLQDARRVAEEIGVAEGRARGEQELAEAVAAARTLARTLETAMPADVEMVARTVAELAVLCARRILDGELRADPAVLVSAIESGVRQAAGAAVVTVELHPSTIDAVQAAWAARHGTRHRGIAWSFAADPALAADGCRLRTEHGIVEAGLSEQLAQVAAALEAAVPAYVASAVKDVTPAPAPSPAPASAAAPDAAPVAEAGS